jgi:hypothetical protein
MMSNELKAFDELIKTELEIEINPEFAELVTQAKTEVDALRARAEKAEAKVAQLREANEKYVGLCSQYHEEATQLTTQLSAALEEEAQANIAVIQGLAENDKLTARLAAAEKIADKVSQYAVEYSIAERFNDFWIGFFMSKELINSYRKAKEE